MLPTRIHTTSRMAQQTNQTTQQSVNVVRIHGSLFDQKNSAAPSNSKPAMSADGKAFFDLVATNCRPVLSTSKEAFFDQKQVVLTR